MMARARRGAEAGRYSRDIVRDTLLSICASSDDPIARGRHKVWGSRELWVPPQTSTIASHLPKAVGTAFAIGRARRMGCDPGVPDDAIVVCSFGDASANHASALTGITAARYGNRRGNPLPILFVCEDNRIGISVDTPRRWIRDSFSNLTQLRYIEAEGELPEIWRATHRAVEMCRTQRVPVFLHLITTRLWGHAGSDIETAYRSPEEIRAAEALDPLLLNARWLVEHGVATPDELSELVHRVRRRVREAGEWAAERPHLSDARTIMEPLAPLDLAAAERDVAERATPDDAAARRAFWSDDPPEAASAPVKRTLAAHLSAALADEMRVRPETLIFGEDVGRKGGVYYVTAGLQKRFGMTRVIDTQLDETSILGFAQGSALLGLLPIPEIQYLAYVHNAVDQLRGEASSLSFFSDGQYTNPMVVRIASWAYQKGFGGHFHNDNSIGGLRDIPGLILATPARGDDAVRMLRGCLAVARRSGRVIAFLEPIALYHERDRFTDGDGGWLSDHPPPGQSLLPGQIGVWHDPEALGPDDADASTSPPAEVDLLIVTYANGVRMSLQAARRLRDEQGLRVRVIDLRWLQPLPLDALGPQLAGLAGAGAVLVADEARATGGGVADAVIAGLVEGGWRGRIGSVRSLDSFVPLGPAADAVLLQPEQIIARAHELLGLDPGA
jgi:2-oxoisovalerate dehydrogenase E1 component